MIVVDRVSPTYMSYGYNTGILFWRVNMAGYPGDKPGRCMWRTSCRTTISWFNRLFYRCDTYNGMSGSYCDISCLFDGYFFDNVTLEPLNNGHAQDPAFCSLEWRLSSFWQVCPLYWEVYPLSKCPSRFTISMYVIMSCVYWGQSHELVNVVRILKWSLWRKWLWCLLWCFSLWEV